MSDAEAPAEMGIYADDCPWTLDTDGMALVSRGGDRGEECGYRRLHPLPIDSYSPYHGMR
jgi:hypothetical protein